MSSASFRFAVEAYHELRAEFEDFRAAAYALAAEECRGALLNARGRGAGIDAYDLFMGNRARAHAYASPELLEHWESHPRVTFAEFERQRFLAERVS